MDSAKNDLKIRRCIGCYCVEHRQCKKEAYQWSGVYNAVIIQLIYQLAILLKCTLHLSAQEQSCKTRAITKPPITEKSSQIFKITGTIGRIRV